MLVALCVGDLAHAGSLNPTNAPGQPASRTTQEIFDALAIGGTALMRTGDTSTNYPFADGTYQTGVPWPNPRFIAGTGAASNCVTDRLTGLVWMRSPPTNRFSRSTSAAHYCSELNGEDGRGGYTDWRLPTNREWLSLLTYIGGWTTNIAPFHYQRPYLAIERFWSSTMISEIYSAWLVNIELFEFIPEVGVEHPVWPVRGGP